MTKLSSKLWLLSIAGLFAVALTILPDQAFAASDAVGKSLFDDVQGLIQGNIGVIAGLLISLFGLWMWLVQQSSWGLLIVSAGAALTAFPGIYGSLSQGLKGAFKDTGGSAADAKTPTSSS